jgi:two-component SAPR family response regulator
MDFVKSLASPPIIVFTTAYSEYAVEGYKVDAVDYLLKPFGLDEFQRAANKVKRVYEQINDNDSSQLKVKVFQKTLPPYSSKQNTELSRLTYPIYYMLRA